MIKLEDIPNTGVLILNVYFKDYKDNYANDSRKKLKEKIPMIGKEFGIQIIPIQFSLIRNITACVTRAVGAQYQYRFSQMTSENFQKLYNKIKKIKFGWWESFEIIIGNYVEGFE